jgi:hypothetical protein
MVFYPITRRSRPCLSRFTSTLRLCWTGKIAEFSLWVYREEGALGNSNHWYRRAKKTMPEYDLAQEWNELYEYITSKDKNT